MRWGRVFVVGLAVSAMSCLSPTEIVLVISTDVACGLVTQNGVAIAVGEPGDENSGVATTTRLCAGDGGIGTAVILPHASIDQRIGIRVTLGIDAGADKCGPPDFSGCIVSRRTIAFDPHTPLALPVDLDQACIGVPCTPSSTCVSGACVDAGVTCQGSSCGLEDSGAPEAGADAGTCQPIPDVPVATGTGQASPRVAVSSDGWAVAWETTLFGIELSDLHLFGGTLTQSQPITLVPANKATTLGPLGADATSYAISYAMMNTSAAYATIVAIDGTPLLTGPIVIAGAVPARFGMHPMGNQTYATAFIEPPNATAFLDTFAPSSGNAATTAGLVTANLTDIALAQGSSSFFAAMADQSGTCSVYQCAYTNTFTCNPAALSTSPSCTAVRVAERLGTSSHVVESNNLLTVDDKYPLNASVLGTSFQVIATSTAFHVVFVTSNGGLILATYDGTKAPMIAQLLTPGNSVVSFDVIADGPNQPGFAIVYAAVDGTATTSVHFMHLCQ